MPDFWSHRYAAEQAYRQTPLTFNGATYPFFQLGAQGPDLFYYLNRTRPYVKKNFRKIGNHLHHKDMKVIFLEMILYAQTHPSDELKAYILGYYTHYIMDVYGHPFICKWGPDSASHKIVEMQLDAFTIQALSGKSIYKSNLKNLHPKKRALKIHLGPFWKHIVDQHTPFILDESIIERSGLEFNRIQWLLVKDILSKLPFKKTLSKAIKYDLNLLVYPKHNNCPWDFEAYKEAFLKGIEETAKGLISLNEVLIGQDSPQEWVDKNISKDYLGV